jgi:zinc and cadmium transporter
VNLIYIVLGTLAAGVGSVLVAALCARALLSAYTQHLLSLAAGALLATAFMHLLPEAFESGASPHQLFITLLVGLVFFFLLDKAELWHHGHEHGHAHGHAHGHGHALEPSQAHHHAHVSEDAAAHDQGHKAQGAPPSGMAGSWSVLMGDSIHAFGDGLLVAAAFLADVQLGVAATVAVLAHEVPHHMGDLVVLQQGMGQPRSALIKLCMAGGVTVLGGLVGHSLIAGHEEWLPFWLTMASSSYIYVALADLIPQLQKRLSASATVAQIGWLFAGIALVTGVTQLGHMH